MLKRISIAFALASTMAFADGYIFGFSGGATATLSLNGGATTIGTDLNPLGGATLNQGWWESLGTHNPSNPNIIVGEDTGTFFNNFFAFDLSGLTGPFADATLNITCGGCGSTGAFPKTYSLFEVLTPAGTVVGGSGPTPAVYTDLGSGVLYASVIVASNPTSMSIVLNGAALSAINNASGAGYFVIGGTLNPSAVGTVPEPSTYAMLGIGLAGMAIYRGRRARKA